MSDYTLHPDWWVGKHFCNGKWHLLHTNGDAVCGRRPLVDEDGPLSSVPAGELCQACERVAVARRIPMEEQAW